MGRPHKVDKVSRESMAQNSVSIDISRPPQSAVSVDVARTPTETPTRQVAQENHQYSRQPNENSTTTQTVVISELPAQQVRNRLKQFWGKYLKLTTIDMCHFSFRQYQSQYSI